MSLLADLKHKLFLRKLAEELKTAAAPPTAAQPPSLVTATSLVILFPADSAEDRKAVDRWRDANRRRQLKIDVVGFFRGDVGGASFDFRALSDKDTNWYGLPRGSEVTQFLREPSELVIRLGPAAHRELDYLAALKPACLKVGPISKHPDNPYHLQFDPGGSAQMAAQLKAIERIFTFTNARATSKV